MRSHTSNTAGLLIYERTLSAVPTGSTPRWRAPQLCQAYAVTGRSLTYVQRQLGHASINLTADTDGKWLPLGNKAAVDRLDATIVHESGSDTGLGSGRDVRSRWKIWRAV